MSTSRARALTVVGAAFLTGASLAIGGSRLASPLADSRLWAAPGPTSAEQVLVALAGLGLAATGLYLLALSLLCCLDLLGATGRPAVVGATRVPALGPARGRPPGRFLRVPGRGALVRACAPPLGAALLWGTAVGPAQGREPAPTDPTIRSALDGLPLPQRPTTQPRARVRVVIAGESLWSIAAGLIGPGPGQRSAAEVDRAWRALYRANRERVGPDPDLLYPGTRLSLPASLVLPTPDPSR